MSSSNSLDLFFKVIAYYIENYAIQIYIKNLQIFLLTYTSVLTELFINLPTLK